MFNLFGLKKLFDAIKKGFKCNDLQLKSAWELLGGYMDGNSRQQISCLGGSFIAGWQCPCPGYFIHILFLYNERKWRHVAHLHFASGWNYSFHVDGLRS